eukprot:gene54079-12112_t
MPPSTGRELLDGDAGGGDRGGLRTLSSLCPNTPASATAAGGGAGGEDWRAATPGAAPRGQPQLHRCRRDGAW